MKKTVTSEERLEVYALLEEQIDAIQHFDELQFIIRKISLTLLMGTFAGIGFLLSIKADQLPFTPITISIFICLFSIIMNFILASIDLIFVERLLTSTFIDALRLEKENPWLFPIHIHMMNSAKEHHGSILKKVQFYIGYNKDLLFLLFVSIFFTLGIENWKLILFLIVPSIIVFMAGYGKILKSASERSQKHLYSIFKTEVGDLKNG